MRSGVWRSLLNDPAGAQGTTGAVDSHLLCLLLQAVPETTPVTGIPDGIPVAGANPGRP